MSHRRYALVGAGHRAQMYVDAITGRTRTTQRSSRSASPTPCARRTTSTACRAGLPAPTA